MTTLFDPLQAGDLALANRIVMAPLTRNRSPQGGARRPRRHLLRPARHGRADRHRGHRHQPSGPGLCRRARPLAPTSLPAGSGSPTPFMRPAARSWSSSGMSGASRMTPAAGRRQAGGAVRDPGKIQDLSWSSRTAAASSSRPPSPARWMQAKFPASSMISAARQGGDRGSGFRRRRDPWRQRLSDRPVPALGHQPSQRQLWRFASKTGRASCSRWSTR